MSAPCTRAVPLSQPLVLLALLLALLVLAAPVVASRSPPHFLYHSVLLRTATAAQPPPTIVVVHGLLGSSRNFQSWCRLLSQRMDDAHDIVVVDLRCHGRSVKLEGPTTLNFEEMGRDLLFTLGKLNIKRAHLIGHSLGGKVVAQATLLHADADYSGDLELVSTTLLDISPIRYQGSLEFKGVLSTVDFLVESKEHLSKARSKNEALDVIKNFTDDLQLQQFLTSCLSPLSYGFGWRFNAEAIQRSKSEIEDFSPAVASCAPALPVLILKGAKSSFVRSSHVPSISQLFPLFTVASVDDAGHWLHSERPAEVADKVSTFLRRAAEFRTRP